MLLLEHGRVVDPASQLDAVCDLLIDGDQIAAVGPSLRERLRAEELRCVLDLRGKVVMPGFVDLHVHLREPGGEDQETIRSGLRAAIHGGVTSLACMPNTAPAIDSVPVLQGVLRRAREERLADVYPIACITKARAGRELTEMLLLHRAGAAAFSDDGSSVQDAAVMRRAMDYSKAADALLISHCEDAALSAGGVINEGIVSTELGLPSSPAEAEELMIARDLQLARLTGCRLHIAHVSTAAGMEMIRGAKAAGVRVTAEVTPHHLCLTEEAVRGYNPDCKVNPPLRTAEDCAALLEALRDGAIDCIATDHAPHTRPEKEVEYSQAANGISGLETSAALIWSSFVRTGRLTPLEMARAMSTRPAEILGIPKGTLAPGSAADITVLDVTAERPVDRQAFYSKGKNTPFQGWMLTGWPDLVLKDGRVVLQNGRLLADADRVVSEPR